MPPGRSPLHPLLRAPLLILIPQQADLVRQNIAAQQNHRDACFALTAWYLVGSPGVLPQSDTEAFLWAKRAAEAELVKAMYAVGYFLEVGIGTSPDMKE
jgi:TPR repeat protein